MGERAAPEMRVVRGSSELHPPPSGAKIALVLGGLVAACVVACVAFAVGYVYYLDLRGTR